MLLLNKEYFNLDESLSLYWDEVRSKVILFNRDEAVSYANLEVYENDYDNAVKVGKKILQGRGVFL